MLTEKEYELLDEYFKCRAERISLFSLYPDEITTAGSLVQKGIVHIEEENGIGPAMILNESTPAWFDEYKTFFLLYV